MDELIAATGLGKATVYRLFATKDELIGAYLRRHAQTILVAIDADIAHPPRRPSRRRARHLPRPVVQRLRARTGSVLRLGRWPVGLGGDPPDRPVAGRAGSVHGSRLG
jgi:AcrR family transcriptional regulator